MFCPKCGNQMPDSAKFCGKCGSPIAAPVQQHAQAAQAQPATAAQPQAARPVAAGTAARPVARAMPIAAAGSQASVIENVPFLTMKNVGYIALAACALGIIGFFLPWISVIGIEISGLQMVTGVDKGISSFEGDPLNILYIALPIVALAAFLATKGKVRWIVSIACGALLLVCMIGTNVYWNDQFGSYAALFSLGFGYYIVTLGAVLLLAAGVLGFMGTRKGLA